MDRFTKWCGQVKHYLIKWGLPDNAVLNLGVLLTCYGDDPKDAAISMIKFHQYHPWVITEPDIVIESPLKRKLREFKARQNQSVKS